MPSEIYLDNSTLAAPSQSLLEHTQRYMKEWCEHSPTAPYFRGRKLLASIEEVLEEIYSFVGADREDQFIFSHSGAAATVQVYMSAILDRRLCSRGNCILTPPVGMDSSLFMKGLFERLGVSLRRAPLDAYGGLTEEILEEILSFPSHNIGLLSLPWANAYTGVIHPIEQLAEVCQKKDILLHVDASSVLGKLHFQYAHIPIDYLTFDGRLIHGLSGSGGTFAREKKKLEPLVFEDQLNMLRNIPLFMGLGVAFRELRENFDCFAAEGARLRDLLEEGIRESLPQTKILFHQTNRLPHISLIVFPGVSSELLSFHLREQGIFAFFDDGYGQSLEEHLTSFAVAPLDARSALSFSLSRNTKEEEIRRAVEIITHCVQKCCSYSKGLMS